MFPETVSGMQYEFGDFFPGDSTIGPAAQNFAGESDAGKFLIRHGCFSVGPGSAETHRDTSAEIPAFRIGILPVLQRPDGKVIVCVETRNSGAARENGTAAGIHKALCMDDASSAFVFHNCAGKTVPVDFRSAYESVEPDVDSGLLHGFIQSQHE